MQTNPEFGNPNPESVADELAIRRVLAANEQAITENDVTAYVNTFSEDAQVTYWDGVATGREAIGTYFQTQQQHESVRDVILNLVILIEGDTAIATGSALVIRAQKAPAQLLATTTVYSTMARVNGIWYIAKQRKKADPSFDPTVGSISDVVERLTERVTKLEDQ